MQEVASVTWENVASGLSSNCAACRAYQTRSSAEADSCHYFSGVSAHEWRQARVYHLYKNLADTFDIDIVSQGISTDTRSERENRTRPS